MPDTIELLIIDDNTFLLAAVSVYLESKTTPDGRAFHVTVSAGWPSQAMLDVEHRYDGIILDWMIPKLDAVQLVRDLRQQAPGAVIVVISGYDFASDAAEMQQLLSDELDGFVPKTRLTKDLIPLFMTALTKRGGRTRY